MPIWPNPGGLTAIVVECQSSGSNGSDRTNLWGGRGGGGAPYSRVRLTGAQLEASHFYHVGVGTPFGGQLTDFKDGSDANTLCRAESTGAQWQAVDNITNGVGDTKYNGGSGRSEGALFVPAPGGGGGGAAGRYSNGQDAVDDMGGAATPPGGSGGNGGAIGAEGNPGNSPGGGAGGGGYTDPPPGVPDTPKQGGDGWIIIWDDSAGQVGGSGAGFVPNADAFLFGDGDFQAPPAPSVSDFRRTLSVM